MQSHILRILEETEKLWPKVTGSDLQMPMSMLLNKQQLQWSYSMTCGCFRQLPCGMGSQALLRKELQKSFLVKQKLQETVAKITLKFHWSKLLPRLIIKVVFKAKMLSVVCWFGAHFPRKKNKTSIICSLQISVTFSFQHSFTKKLIYHFYITGAEFSTQPDKIKHVTTMYTTYEDQIRKQVNTFTKQVNMGSSRIV